MICSIFTDSNWVPHRCSFAVLPLQRSIQLHTVPIRKIMRRIQCAKQYKLQEIHSHNHTIIQSSNINYNYINTFLTFVAQAVFHTLSPAGRSNIHETLFIDVKSFHQNKKLRGNYRYFPFPEINFGS